MLLTADDDTLAAQPLRRFTRCWIGLLLQSTGWGIVLAAVWQYTWGLFGDAVGLLIMPSLCAAAVMCLWPYRRAVASVGEVYCGDPTMRGIISSVMVVVIAGAILSAPAKWLWMEQLYPPYEAARAMLLMPLWGAWAMMIASQISPASDRTERVVAAFARGCGPVASSLTLALPVAATWLWFRHIGWRHWEISAFTAGIALVSGVLSGQRAGGLCRRSLLAANLLTQLAFLLMCIHSIRAGP